MYRPQSKGHRRLTVRRSFHSANRFMQSIPGNDMGDMEIAGEKIEPIRAMGFISDFVVPLAIAFMIAVLVTALALLIVSELGYIWTIRQAAILFVALMLAAFLLWISKAYMLTWVKETLDEYLPEPEPQPVIELTVNVADKNDKVATMLRPQFQVTPTQLVEFASGVIHAKKTLSQKTWVDDEKLFTRPEFDAFMAECEKAKLVERKGSATNSPRILTTLGEQTFTEVWENRLDILD